MSYEGCSYWVVIFEFNGQWDWSGALVWEWDWSGALVWE